MPDVVPTQREACPKPHVESGLVQPAVGECVQVTGRYRNPVPEGWHAPELDVVVLVHRCTAAPYEHVCQDVAKRTRPEAGHDRCLSPTPIRVDGQQKLAHTSRPLAGRVGTRSYGAGSDTNRYS